MSASEHSHRHRLPALPQVASRRRPTNPLNMKPQTCRERIFPIVRSVVRRPRCVPNFQLAARCQVFQNSFLHAAHAAWGRPHRHCMHAGQCCRPSSQSRLDTHRQKISNCNMYTLANPAVPFMSRTSTITSVQPSQKTIHTDNEGSSKIVTRRTVHAT